MMTPSDETDLRKLLAQVHERLSHAHTVDPQTRRLLTTLTRDIEHTLGGGAPARSGAGREVTHGQSLASLNGLAARFDADHPALAQTLRQLVDLLGKAGI